MLEKLLAILFPPEANKLGRVYVNDPEPFDEQGWAGNIRRKYRDGIDRTFAEQE